MFEGRRLARSAQRLGRQREPTTPRAHHWTLDTTSRTVSTLAGTQSNRIRTQVGRLYASRMTSRFSARPTAGSAPGDRTNRGRPPNPLVGHRVTDPTTEGPPNRWFGHRVTDATGEGPPRGPFGHRVTDPTTDEVQLTGLGSGVGPGVGSGVSSGSSSSSTTAVGMRNSSQPTLIRPGW